MAQRRVVAIDQRYLDEAQIFLSGAGGNFDPKQAQTLLDMFTDYEVKARLEDTPEKCMALLTRACYVATRINLTYAEMCAVLSILYEQAKMRPGVEIAFGPSS